MKNIIKTIANRRTLASPPAARRVLRISIASKLALNSLLTISIISAIFILVGIYLINNRIVTEAQERVNDGLNAARGMYQSKLDHVFDVVQLSANRSSVVNALLTGDKSKAIEELVAVETKNHLDILILTDPTGSVALRTNNLGASGDNQIQNQLIAAVIQRKTPLEATGVLSAQNLTLESVSLVKQANILYIDTPLARSSSATNITEGMFLEAAAPIFDPQGKFIGVLFGGTLLNNNNDIVDEIKQTIFQGVKYNNKDIGVATLFLDDVRISTNVMNADGTRAIGSRVSEDVYNRVVIRGETWTGRAYGVNNWYITAYEPVKNFNNQIIGILGVGILEQKYIDIKNQTILAFLIIALLGTLASMMLSYFISRRITSHIQVLVSASREVAHGNLNVKVETISNDELGELATTFNSMATALKERDERLKEFARNKIMESERLALIGQLSANVAHELNNPLQGIVTYSHLLLEEAPAENPSTDLLQKIVIQANRCRDIIRGLLDFSRQRKPDKTLCDVNTVLKGCVSLLENQAIFHNIQVTYNVDAQLPRAIIDPSQIERVFMNIVINAAEAMNGNGQLQIATRSDPAGQFIEVEIADTGPGIAKDNLERIFDPFFTTKDTGHGVGLGLAISYGIVKEHEGTISVESEVGKGTTFTVRLPVSVDEENN
jgi:two-component system NtrC family sensor kinase